MSQLSHDAPPVLRCAGEVALIIVACIGLFASAPTRAQTLPAQYDAGVTVTELDRVTVSALGRDEDALTVPYNISVVSGEAIEQANVLDAAELMRRIAGVGVVDRGARSASVVNGIRIRGLNVDMGALGEYAVAAAPTVATYVDNTALFANFLLTDIDRVEVLRGPQGTLYGSGAMGGAIRFLLRKPETDSFEGQASAGLSSTQYSAGIGKSGSLTLNMPLSNTLAVRLNSSLNDTPGISNYRNLYVLDASGTPVAPAGVLSTDAAYEERKDVDTVKQAYGRVAVLWKPNDTFDATLSYLAQADRMGGRRATSLGVDGFGNTYRDLEVGSVQVEPAARHVNLASLEAHWNSGIGTLSSSTATYSHQGNSVTDLTGLYAQNHWLAALYRNYPRPMVAAVRHYGDRAFTQEFRFTSILGDHFDYVAGAYYQDQERYTRQNHYLRGLKQWWDAANPTNTAALPGEHDYEYRWDERFKEGALYGELTWSATDALRLTGGIRTARDDSATQVDQTFGVFTGRIAHSASQSADAATRTLLKGNVSWTFSGEHQLYATISEGYRRGGTNGTPTVGAFAEDPAWVAYRADSVVNYELGFKGRASGITYNADIFYVDWRDPQINTTTTRWGFVAVQNVDKASTRGLELELSVNVNAYFLYSFGYTYTDARLEADAFSADGTTLFGTTGTRLPGVSRHRFNASGIYEIPLSHGSLSLRGDVYYQSESDNALSQSPRFAATMGGFSLFNLSATYTKDAWAWSVWLKNATNRAGITGLFTPQLMGTSPEQNYFGDGSKAAVTLPRTLGITMSMEF